MSGPRDVRPQSIGRSFVPAVMGSEENCVNTSSVLESTVRVFPSFVSPPHTCHMASMENGGKAAAVSRDELGSGEGKHVASEDVMKPAQKQLATFHESLMYKESNLAKALDGTGECPGSSHISSWML